MTEKNENATCIIFLHFSSTQPFLIFLKRIQSIRSSSGMSRFSGIIKMSENYRNKSLKFVNSSGVILFHPLGYCIQCCTFSNVKVSHSY